MMTEENEWKRDWVVEPVPCEGKGCTPKTPTCAPCTKAVKAFVAEGFPESGWHEILNDFGRESWRREAADA